MRAEAVSEPTTTLLRFHDNTDGTTVIRFRLDLTALKAMCDQQCGAVDPGQMDCLFAIRPEGAAA